MKLSKAHKNFLQRHNLGIKDCFDTEGQPLRVYKPLMKKLGRIVALGVTPCLKYGHIMRDYRGRCLFCYPENLGYIKNHRAERYVYIAYSKKGKLVKIGSTSDMDSKDKREKTLNKQAYGGENDWVIKKACMLPRSGEVEQLIQRELETFRVIRHYMKNQRLQESIELFTCTLKKAMIIFDKIMENNNKGIL